MFRSEVTPTLYLSFRYTELTSIEKMNLIIPTANLPSGYAWDWKDECQEGVLFRLQNLFSYTHTSDTAGNSTYCAWAL